VSGAANDPWYKADKHKAHTRTFDYVRRVQQEQGDVFDRFVKLEALYDPFSPQGDELGDAASRLANVTENVVAGNIDTVHAAVATTEVRARIQTDYGDWGTQRRAKYMELYAEGLGKELALHAKCRLAFKGCAKKGGGAVKVWADRWGDVRAMHVPIDDLVVADVDARADGPPRQLHHVQRNVDKDDLAAEYPDAEDEIRTAHGPKSRNGAFTGLRPINDNTVVVIESIRLPIGKRPARMASKGKTRKAEAKEVRRGAPKYIPGRRVVAIENRDLVDEPYHKPYYPIAVISWLSREGSFYGISLAERIAGIQRALNKRNWQIDRTLDHNANLVTYYRPADANAQVRTNKIGLAVPIKGDWPQRPAPPAVHPEIYRSRLDLREAAYEESGVSRLAAQSKKPGGLDSGAALREYRDQTTQRFAPQEQDFERLVLDAIFLALDACKDLGADAPTIIRESARWKPVITWSEVDMGELKLQISAASTIPRTPAGRTQLVIEWAQAGVISQDEARRLMGHQDLGRALSLYTAALESVEEQLEMILDGEIVVPEPYDNLAMCMWRGTAQYHLARQGKAPEEVLEGIRTYIVQAGAILDMRKQPQNANVPAVDPATGTPIAAADPTMPAAPTDLPMEAPGGVPQAAFASQAMDLMAG
jgi:hypothetical protein